MTEAPAPRLLFVVTEDWYFVSHRLPVARRAKAMGFDVVVATRVNRHAQAIEQEGFRLVPLKMKRRGASLWGELMALWELIGLYRRERPTIIQHIAMKPILLGSFAALFSSAAVINTFAGLGFLFSRSTAARWLRPLIVLWLRVFASGAYTIVQNADDRDRLFSLGICRAEKTELIPGSGVDTSRFQPAPEPSGPFTVAFVSRMLWDKGAGVAVDAVRLLRARGLDVRLLLVGAPDRANPRAVPEETLRDWDREDGISWQGRRDDIEQVWREAHVAVLPTDYPEGLPKSLLEAAAAGRAMVASTAPGCRELVLDGETGLLVPPQDAEAVAEALGKLANDPACRERLGRAARRAVEARFSETVIAQQTGALYRRVAGG